MITVSNQQFEDLSSQLEPVLAMLNALCHRNKNQHRHSAWWRDIGILRRAIRRLLDETLPKMRPERVRWLGSEIMPTSYVSFTQLMADNQFAQLGLALIAILARVNTALQPLLPPPEPLSPSAQEILGHPTEPQPKTQRSRENVNALLVPDSHDAFDMGVSITRASVEDDNILLGGIDGTPTSDRKKENSLDDIFGDAKPKKKKKQQAGTGFDDIFGDAISRPKKKNKLPRLEPDGFNSIFSESKAPKKKTTATDAGADSFDDIFGAATATTSSRSKLKKKRPAETPEDDFFSNMASAASSERKKKKESGGGLLDNIFEDTTKKKSKKSAGDESGAKKKKKSKTKSGTDMSDIFGSL